MTEPPTKGKKINLFDYTEEDLLNTTPPILTYYEVLDCPVYATQNEVKKAYRKASLNYHPDKTGRGDDDYVFLAVKAAHDTLMDHAKRQAYDSTVLPFDDSIPAVREKLIQDPFLLYSDDDFYKTFGSVFERNLRFDARLRPDLVKGSNSKKVNQKQHHHAPPPSIGDADTPLDKVHHFYAYWVGFDSWRDFSSQAADELQVENELENAESRYEKRWIQKEVDKRAKALKRTEMQRIQSLVERAMEADPRLRKERASAQEQKQRAAAEKIAAQQREKEEKERNLIIEAELIEQDKIRQKEEKIIREKEKKLIRKERQSLRKTTSQAFEACNFNNGVWKDSYELSQDIDFLCNMLDIEALKSLNADFCSLSQDPLESLQITHKCVIDEKQRQKQIEEEKEQLQKKHEQEMAVNGKLTESNIKSNRNNPWTKEELSALAKGLKKYPPGGASRWDQIALFINNLCKQQNPRSKEECIDKYNQISRDAASGSANKGGHSSNGNGVTSNKNGGEISELRSSENVPNGSNLAEVVDSAKMSTTPVVVSDDQINRESDPDMWTTEQDRQLQEALANFPATMDKNERWANISKSVTGKSKKDCVQRFKVIRETLQQNKK